MLQSRDELRKTYFTAWANQQKKLPLSAVEKQIVAVLIDHPEYHAYFDDPENQFQEYPVEINQTNPYLHLGLHIAIREQIHTNAPHGIFDAYMNLVKKHQGDHLKVEHMMMDCLAEAIYHMQRTGVETDMNLYLEKIQQL